MNRKSFLRTLVSVDTTETQANMEPYSKPLSQQEVLHLLRRTSFSVSWVKMKPLVGKTASQVVELLLDNALKDPSPTPPTWQNDSFKNPWKLPAADRQKAADVVYKTLYDQNYELKRWWLDVMTTETMSIREKMTLFWHGHFTTKFAIDQMMPAQLMLKQNEMFRKSHQGNFRKLVEAITIDSAMLIFLNGQDSTRKSPNENFSRELLELYTIGIGNYTEKDVQEGARILTGWRTNIFSDEYQNIGVYKPFFLYNEHDVLPKTYLGATIPATTENSQDDVYKNEVQGMVDIILKRKTIETANFICEKLYRYFVFANAAQVNKEVVAELSKTFIENNFEIRPVLAKLLKSTFFFDSTNIGTQIKTPSELIVGITKHFDVKPDWKEWVMVTMGQELFNPPNVSGWAGYRKWSDTRTFPFAIQQIGNFIGGQKDVHIVEWVKQFDDFTDAQTLVRNITSLLLGRVPMASQMDRYVRILLNNIPDYEWKSVTDNIPTAAIRIKALLIAITKDPNFHLG